MEETFGPSGTLGRETRGEVVLVDRLRASLDVLMRRIRGRVCGELLAPGHYPTSASHPCWMAELKASIHASQQRAMLAVNRELVLV